jgi:hypothetical protein
LGAIQIARSREAQHQAFLCSLGVDLISFKFANRPSAKQDSEDKLAIALGWAQWKLKLSKRAAHEVSIWTVQEWAIDLCPTCKGAGHIPNQERVEGVQPMKPCPSCATTGKRRYSDSERHEALGGPFDKALSVAHGIIGRAEDLAVRQAKTMLERW